MVACLRAGEEAKALLSAFRTLPCLAQAGGQISRCLNAPRLMKSHLCCVSFFFPPPFPLLQVVSALESNPTARRTQLHHKFEQVIALVEDNIYECCSEA